MGNPERENPMRWANRIPPEPTEEDTPSTVNGAKRICCERAPAKEKTKQRRATPGREPTSTGKPEEPGLMRKKDSNLLEASKGP
jgi:hypothetical protein